MYEDVKEKHTCDKDPLIKYVEEVVSCILTDKMCIEKINVSINDKSISLYNSSDNTAEMVGHQDLPHVLTINYVWAYHQAEISLYPYSRYLFNENRLQELNRALIHELSHLYTIPIFETFEDHIPENMKKLYSTMHEQLVEKIAYHIVNQNINEIVEKRIIIS